MLLKFPWLNWILFLTTLQCVLCKVDQAGCNTFPPNLGYTWYDTFSTAYVCWILFCRNIIPLNKFFLSNLIKSVYLFQCLLCKADQAGCNTFPPNLGYTWYDTFSTAYVCWILFCRNIIPLNKFFLSNLIKSVYLFYLSYLSLTLHFDSNLGILKLLLGMQDLFTTKLWLFEWG